MSSARIHHEEVMDRRYHEGSYYGYGMMEAPPPGYMYAPPPMRTRPPTPYEYVHRRPTSEGFEEEYPSRPVLVRRPSFHRPDRATIDGYDEYWMYPPPMEYPMAYQARMHRGRPPQEYYMYESSKIRDGPCSVARSQSGGMMLTDQHDGYDFRDDVNSEDSWLEEQARLKQMRLQAGSGYDWESEIDKRQQLDAQSAPPDNASRASFGRNSPAVSRASVENPLRSPGSVGSRSRSSHSSVNSRQRLSGGERYKSMTSSSIASDGGSATRLQKSKSSMSANSRASAGSRQNKQSDLRDEMSSGSTGFKIERNRSSLSENSKESNPQLLHAKSIPELPQGYLQRKDGVVISFGSSVASDIGPERYADPNYHPIEAAQIVVENLRSQGYRIDEADGLVGSYSDTGSVSRYGGRDSQCESVSGMSNAKAANTNKSVSSSGSTRAKVKTSGNRHGIFGPPSMISRAKVVEPSAPSTASGYETHTVSRRNSRSPTTNTKTNSSSGGSCETSSSSESSSESRHSSDIGDGSTLTTRIGGTMGGTLADQEGTVLVDVRAKELLGNEVYNGPNLDLDQNSVSTKRVNFSGEYPPLTSDGDRVPELILRQHAVPNVVSDITQRSHGLTSVSSVTFHQHRTNAMESFFDKLLYSCRISAFPPSR